MKKTIIFVTLGVIFVIAIITNTFLIFPKKYMSEIDSVSKKYNLDKYLIASVINIESGYQVDSVSHADARGLMQLLPSTAVDLANRLKMIDFEVADLFDPSVNIELGAFYLRYLLDMFDDNLTNALCAYNWGLNNVRNWIGLGNVDGSNTITNIPIKETSEYIIKFRLNKFVYKDLYRY